MYELPSKERSLVDKWRGILNNWKTKKGDSRS